MHFGHIDWNLVAVWVQTVANTVVLFMIYLQMRQVQEQMTQSDEQERFSRSWEFVKLYRDELREAETHLDPYRDEFDALCTPVESPAYQAYFQYFYKPRWHLFLLLNHLVAHQEVDERLLFGYLEDEFNRFVEIGLMRYGQDFKTDVCKQMNILIGAWASQIRSGKLLYSNELPKCEVAPAQVPAQDASHA